jgi:ligand-binding sensor domain-containing protein/signal transduction histidine kinase/DNA-binding response OmpR family regulator
MNCLLLLKRYKIESLRLFRVILLFIVFENVVFNQLSFAQKFHFSHLTLADGLSNGNINCITQDSIGFIWIGTNDGLNRFDGNKIKIYTHWTSDTNSIITNTIQDLLCEGDNIWVCTNKGIDFYNAEDEKYYHIPIKGLSEPTNISVFNIFKDFSGKLFIATHKGLFVYNKKSNVFNRFSFPYIGFSVPNNAEITWITQDRDGTYWIGTSENGVFIFNEKTNKSAQIKHLINNTNTLINNKVFCIYEDNLHTVWIGTNEGLYAYLKTTNSIVRYLPKIGQSNWLPHITINRIMEDSRNNLWLATNGGLSKFNRKDSSFISFYHDDFDESSLLDNSIHSMFEDVQKNLWIGSGENGLNILKSQSIEFENFKKTPNNKASLNYGYVVSIIEDKFGDVWVGTNGFGINKFEKKTGKFKYFTPPSATKVGSQTASIISLYEDKEGKIWIGTYLGGLTVYDPKNKKYTSYAFDPENPDGLSNNIVNNVIQDSKSRMWIATNGGGINILNPGDVSFNHIRAGDNSISSDYCTVTYEDKRGNIWIGTYYGLNKYDPLTGTNTVFLNNNSPGAISSDVIYSICENSQGQLWFGTGFGLNSYDSNSNTFINYTVDNGLPNNVINGILEDSRGYLWLSTNKGLCRFDPKTKRATNYNKNDGIAITSFYHGAIFKNKDGKMYFGGSEGVTYFNPDKTNHIQNKMPLVLTELYIYNQAVRPGYNSILKKSITKTSKVELNYDQSFIALEFASLNFINSNKDNFTYYLKGIDRQWNAIGNQRVAIYTNLPAGNYTLFVKAYNENGDETQTSLQIIVKPAFYETKLAYIIYLLLFIGLAYFVYSFIHSRAMYKHNLIVERLEKEKAIEINQAKIRFFVNVSHEFKTPLTLIISPLEKLISAGKLLTQEELNNLYLLIYRNTLRLSRLINQIMDLRKIDTGNVKMYVTNNEIVNFIKEISVSFEEYARNHSIDYSVDCKVEALNVWFDVDKIEKVVYNILSNAFRYTPDGKTIKLVVNKVDNNAGYKLDISHFPSGFVSIAVIDQGKGIPEEQQEKIFSRFYQVHSESIANPASSGVGLSIAKEFIEMHHGLITLKSKLKQGSTFEVLLPLGNSHFEKEELAPDSEIDITQVKISAPEPAIEEQTEVADEFTTKKKKCKLVIAEDNYELRTFLINNLKERYNVYEASNGKIALDLVLQHNPDIVVSDVMMPLMNGIELCKAIKTDLKTSHIPVILLTVLNSINNQLEGFEIGADDYITKPFNLNLLQARIVNLIETRKKLIKKFIDEIKPDPKKYSQSTLDEKFIQKAMDVVEKNLSNIEFTAENFADQIGMSRSNLHIKLKALTNQSATEFIRLIRLKRAAELLTINQYNISEVSYMVGFNSISYFNRCFKQQFSLTPTEFMESSKN